MYCREVTFDDKHFCLFFNVLIIQYVSVISKDEFSYSELLGECFMMFAGCIFLKIFHRSAA